MAWHNIPCRIWDGHLHGDGYGVDQRGGEYWLVHRKAWTNRFGQIPDGVKVLHRCDVRACYEIAHLWLGTQADNVADMDAKKRRAGFKGEANPRHKLTAQKVVQIRQRFAAGETCFAALGREYGVTYVNIRNIVRRRSWVHIPQEAR